MNTETLDRKKRYYQKNRNKILKSLKEKSKPSTQPRAYPTLPAPFKAAYGLFMRYTEQLLLMLLVLACTAYLVAESAHTLSAIEGSGALAKALLCESVLVGISMMAASTRKMQLMRVMVLVGLATLSLLNTIGGPLSSYMMAKQRIGSQREESVILNRTIDQKQTLLVRYLATDRISGARRIESEIAALSERVSRIKQRLSEEKSESALTFGLMLTVLFRLVISAALNFPPQSIGEFRSNSKTPV